MNETELRQKIRKLIKEVLSEANTINDDVEEKATEIYNIVCKKKLTDKDVVIKTYPDGTVKKTYSVQDKFLGKNCLYSGYWKVYHNKNDAIKTFDSYNRCRFFYTNTFLEGKNILEIIESYSDYSNNINQKKNKYLGG